MALLKEKGQYTDQIKWSRNLKRRFTQGRSEKLDPSRLRLAEYRPYVNHYLYDSDLFVDELGLSRVIFPRNADNRAICVSFTNEFRVLATGRIHDLHFVGDAQGLPLATFDEHGSKLDNVTNWAFDQFRKHYQSSRGKKVRPITKEAIFHYVYGVLHNPVYREKYALNLKREFPRIPFYPDFWQWADWGKVLMELHIGYELVAPFPLKRTDVPDERARKAGLAPKAMLKADKDGGRIILDSETTLSGVPAETWDYTLGNRCALEWILDQYKEQTPKDPTIREKFNTYRFADYKEKVVDLLMRVTTVSIETQRIVEAMRAAPH